MAKRSPAHELRDGQTSGRGPLLDGLPIRIRNADGPQRRMLLDFDTRPTWTAIYFVGFHARSISTFYRIDNTTIYCIDTI